MLRAVNIIRHFSRSSGDTHLRVLEIGSGPAILAGLMMHFLGTRHVLVDLPEQAIVGFSFLSEFFPEKQALLPNEMAKANVLRDDADVVFVTPEQVGLLDKRQFDVAVNMFSFQEMSYSTIGEYFDLIRNCLKPEGIFYCMNRVSKVNPSDGTSSDFAEYPWSSSDEFLHDLTFHGAIAGIQISGQNVRESVVRFA